VSRLRYPNPPRDLSHILPSERPDRPPTAHKKNERRQQRQDLIDTRILPTSREQKFADERQKIQKALDAPSVLIKKQTTKTKYRLRRRRKLP
jgi:hypothetical protein